MKLKIFLSIAATVAAIGQLHAQSPFATDALRFSQTHYGSTARFKALGGTQIGIGGDLSSLGGNPAGLGFFTGSEISITPEFNNYSTQSLYLDAQTRAYKDQLHLSHAGVVWNFPAYRSKGSDLKTGWLSYSAGIGYNRTNDFGNSILFSGTNPTSSIADFFADLANDPFYGGPTTLDQLPAMAYEDYLIDYENEYIPVTRFNNNQMRAELRGGSQSEVNFAVGANYSNTFYIGASLNLSSLKYTSDTEFNEEGISDIRFNDVFNEYNYNLSFQQNQTTNGSGINGRLGMIFRPVSTVRLGITFETPTYYSIDDTYSELLSTSYNPGLPEPPIGNTREYYDFSYQLRTPAKLSGGASFFFGSGFIAADIDYIDYSKITFSSRDHASSGRIADENKLVLNNYQSAVNYRIGAEYKLDRFMLRGGYGLQGNPYRNAKNQIKTYSGGLGYRFERFFLDLTYQRNSYDSEISPYTLQNGPTPSGSIENTRSNVFLTLGARF